MIPEWLPPALAYLSVVVFATGVAARAAKYARAPMHVRWELYPVPHEQGKEYGGSYFEEVDWWTHPRKISLWAEIKAMLEEILLIRSVWYHNRSHWYASFPFHFGIYLLLGLVVLLALGAALEPAAGQDSALWAGWSGLTVLIGVAGLALANLGALALLWRRLAGSDLRAGSTFSDYFNLLFILAVFASAGFAWATVDPTFALLRGYLRGLLTFSPVAGAPPAVVAEVTITALFAIYLPFTHMTHFVAKYFTYHHVRWDDAPALGDVKAAERMMSNLQRPVDWAAPHIQTGSSWAEVATEVR